MKESEIVEILNDRVLAEDIIVNGFVYKKKILTQMLSVIRYWHHQGLSEEEIKNRSKDFILSVSNRLHFITEQNIAEVVDKTYIRALSVPYKGDIEFPIYKSEVEKILQIPDIYSQRMLFSMLCFSRLNPYDRDFITVSIGDITKQANNSNMRDKRLSSLSELRKKDKVDFFVTKTGTELCMRINIEEKDMENAEIAFYANNIETFGTQWINKSGYNTISCSICGKEFERNSRLTTRCSDCQKEYRRQYIGKKVRDFRAKEEPILENVNRLITITNNDKKNTIFIPEKKKVLNEEDSIGGRDEQ